MINEIFNEMKWIYKVFAYIMSLSWKGKDLIYIHSTKKTFSIDEIDSRMKIKKAHIINHQPKRVKFGLKGYKMHFKKMQINLYNILRNYDDIGFIAYAGFVNVPFAIYDGYCLGDTKNYVLFDTMKNTSGVYKINFNRKRSNINAFDLLLDDVKEVELYISSSYEIKYQKSHAKAQFEIKSIIDDKISKNYLNDLFYKVADFLDYCRSNKVKKIHMYCASRQPVSFIIGTAIQSHHPEVIVYDFENSEYTWGLSVQKGKIYEKRD
ncbi:MAG: SAVED domain-containing protein [Bacilli bacterium]|jgi:hypothetical protein